MRSDTEFRAAWDLIRAGLNDCQIARAMGIPRGTVHDWRRQGPNRRGWPGHALGDQLCPICGTASLDGWWYAYLLGLYLGDGCLSECARGVYRLRIVLDQRYPAIIQECLWAIRVVRPSGAPPGIIRKIGCVEIYSYWRHWLCLVPQHGRGPKHTRPIELADWQRVITASHPDRFLRGLIQSDGCRAINRVKHYAYPRYQFTNNSADIRALFCWACDLYGVRWRQSNWKTISVSPQPDVAKLDLVVGPKASPARATPPGR